MLQRREGRVEGQISVGVTIFQANCRSLTRHQIMKEYKVESVVYYSKVTLIRR